MAPGSFRHDVLENLEDLVESHIVESYGLNVHGSNINSISVRSYGPLAFNADLGFRVVTYVFGGTWTFEPSVHKNSNIVSIHYFG